MLISNLQSFSSYASGLIPSSARTTFKDNIDGVLYNLGRDITVHLKPAKSRCLSGCVFNQTYKKFTNATNQICSECRGDGFILEPRQTVYRANIRWMNQPYADKGNATRTEENFVRTKTVAASYDHIKDSIGATIDGINVEVYQEPRTSGFGETPLLYTIAYWKRVDRNG